MPSVIKYKGQLYKRVDVVGPDGVSAESIVRLDKFAKSQADKIINLLKEAKSVILTNKDWETGRVKAIVYVSKACSAADTAGNMIKQGLGKTYLYSGSNHTALTSLEHQFSTFSGMRGLDIIDDLRQTSAASAKERVQAENKFRDIAIKNIDYAIKALTDAKNYSYSKLQWAR